MPNESNLRREQKKRYKKGCFWPKVHDYYQQSTLPSFTTVVLLYVDLSVNKKHVAKSSALPFHTNPMHLRLVYS